MTRLTLSVLTLGCAFLITSPQSSEAGPVNVWYLTAGDQDTNWMVQGVGAASFAQQHPNGEFAIAVSGTVRTLGPQQPELGSQYTLAGTYTGVDYAYPAPLRQFYDGATDGTTNNYTVDFVTGGVYRTNLDWSGLFLLFATGAQNNLLGVTYDPTNDSLWVSNWSGSTVFNYTMAGLLLSSFDAGFTSISSLALDPADGTLWMGSQTTQGTFYQFSTAGVLLDTETYADLVSQNTLGGEFNVPTAVPEPASMLLLGLGAIGVARRYRRG